MRPRATASLRARLATLAGGIAAAALLAGCSGGSSTATSMARSTSAGSGFDGAALPAGIGAPDFVLTDQRGRRVSLSRYRGQVIVLSFAYPTCGGPCILVDQQIRGALDQLAHPVPVILLSAEPAADAPSEVARFLARVSLSERAEYLSGSPAALRQLWRRYRVTPPTVDRRAFERGLTVLLIDRRGNERVVFGLEQLTPEALAHDIGELQAG